MLLPEHWFTEVVATEGSAFSLRIHEKLHTEQSPYQKIDIYRTEHFGNLMVIDGCTMLSSRDNFIYHEMLAHPAVLTHPRPRRVCIIGGGDCGTLREVLRHQEVEAVTQIDIDERVTRLAERFFPELTEANDDPRAELRFEDGVRWIERAPAGSLDLIIIDSTDPVGPAEGLFSVDFYRSCCRALADGGLLAQQSESPLYHLDIIGAVYRDLGAAGFGAPQTLFFPQPIYPSGWWSVTLAGKGAPLPEPRAISPGIETHYYNGDVHRAALAEPELFKRAKRAW
jgi:spermidine synthase